MSKAKHSDNSAVSFPLPLSVSLTLLISLPLSISLSESTILRGSFGIKLHFEGSLAWSGQATRCAVCTLHFAHVHTPSVLQSCPFLCSIGSSSFPEFQCISIRYGAAVQQVPAELWYRTYQYNSNTSVKSSRAQIKANDCE